MALGIGALLLAGCGAGGVPSSDPPTTTTPPAPPGAVADDGVVQVTLAVAEEAIAGERLWADLTVRNIGDRTVWWQAGGGIPPVAATLTAPGSQPAGDDTWSGIPGDLDGAVPRGFREIAFRDEGHVGLLTVARTQPSVMTPLHPAEERRMRVAADVRLRPDAPVELVARATATFYDDPDDYGGEGSVGPRPPVVAEGRIRVRDHPGDDSRRAVEAFAADRRLRAFVEDTKVDGVENSWHVDVVWSSSAWELTVAPEYSGDARGQSRYRLRYRSGRVVDARRVWWDQAPADDPGGTRFPGAPADDVDN